MYRKFYNTLASWENSKTKEPLLVVGARQVGKTWIIKKFCEETYSDYIYINFESNPALISVFNGKLEPAYIISQLEILTDKKITTKTAIFLDEIQRCERAITSMKYFCESDLNYRVIGAGSLLGVKLHRFESSFPVGKVSITYMFPLDFEEFLLACGQDSLRNAIRNAYTNLTALPEAIHDKAIHYYQDYLFVGGMPQCVNDYVKHGCNAIHFDRSIQNNLILAYSADMTKYTISAAEGMKINEVYQSVPRQLARENPKFKYKEVRTHANKRDFKEPLDWLNAANMVYRICKTDVPNSPLKAYVDEDNFKIYLSDVGLLTCLSGIQYRDIQTAEHNIFKGPITENYVVQALATKGLPLYYYKPSDSMEIDLLLDEEGNIIPVEIKSGRHKRSRSLVNFCEKFTPDKAIRISENNFGKMDKLISIPLYAVFCL